MSSEVKIDLSKLTLEELEKIKFLMPEAVEAEIANRAVYETDIDLYCDAYETLMVLRPLYENMKSCATKRTLTESNVIPFLEKILATADRKKKDYTWRYKCKVNNGLMKPVEVPSSEELNQDIATEENKMEAEVAQAQEILAPIPTPEVAPAPAQMVNQEPVQAPAPAPAPAQAPATNPADMANIMAMAQALAAQQQGK